MKNERSTWWVALGNIGALFFFACLARQAPLIFTAIGFLLFAFVSIPVMIQKAFRKIPLEEINVLTPEQEEKIYNSKQTLITIRGVIIAMILFYFINKKEWHFDSDILGLMYSGCIVYLFSIYFGEYRIGYDFIKRQKFWRIMMIIDTFIITIVCMYIPWGSYKFFLLCGLIFYWAYCWDKQTLNRKKQMIIEQRQANIAKEKTSTTEEIK